MDTSETYIKMHLALPKKFQMQPQEGDYYYDKETGEVGGRMGEVYFNTDKMIKLYEQDQLQAMVKRGREDFFPYNFLWRLYRAISPDSKGNIYNPEFTSMEQLGLAFVVKERWNKVWNRSEWTVT